MILHCIVCFGDIGTKPKEWFNTALLLCAWDAAGVAVAPGTCTVVSGTSGGPDHLFGPVSGAHRLQHCSVLIEDNREVLHGLHRASALSAVCRDAGGVGSSLCSHGDLMAALALPVIPQVLPWSGMHLCTWCTPQCM